MRRIAIFAISSLAVTSAFSQTAPKAAAAPPAAPATAAAPVAQAPSKGPHPKSAEENAAVVAMSKATDPDGRIKAAEALLAAFPETDYKALALSIEAESYHQKRPADDAKAITFGERSLEADPKSFETLLLLADIYAQTTRPTDLDMDDRLAHADKYAKQAIAELATAEKPNPQLADADWAAAKKGEEARAWQAMALSAILRKKFDDAKTNIQKSMDLYPDPVDMLRDGRAYLDAKRYDDAMGWFDKAAASPAADDQIKRIASSDKTRAQTLKKAAQ